MAQTILMFQGISKELKLFIFFNIIYLCSLILELDINFNYIFPIFLFYCLSRNFRNFLEDGKIYAYLTVVLLTLLVIGIAKSNFNSYILYDAICFFSFFIIFNRERMKNARRFYTEDFPNCSYVLCIISAATLLIFISIFGFTIASIDSGRGLENAVSKTMSPKYFVAASIFIYPLKQYFKRRLIRIFFDINILLYIFFGLTMGSRGTTLMGVIIFFLTNTLTSYKSISIRRIINRRTALFFVLVTLSLAALYNVDAVRSATDYLVYRFNTERLGEDRSAEASYILESLSYTEVIFGRGLGAANTYWGTDDNLHGVNVVHYGWIFLILKGGVVLLSLIYGAAFYAFIKLFLNRQLRPYSISLLAFIMLESSHTNFSSYLNASYIFVALSAAFIKIGSKSNLNS